eukprot:CAMPEP_0113478834 /NCGR_PEP_ID=MMETSP0014_2-20120614/20972_1 /TAXON_ID=2857 /ORGANISM="Nitzschia sp." /LENGTH=95 /DNA_ID=CAMNT_0000372061 /DNA_START=212 /DNA_END=496 /DNA_ORIENTATION=+ /assembly_acc=CAM_ASM_000159
MPASLDDDARGIILKVTSITVSTLICASFYAYRVMQQEKDEKQKKTNQKGSRNQDGKKQTTSTSSSSSSSSSRRRTGGQHLTRLVVQCLASLGLM